MIYCDIFPSEDIVLNDKKNDIIKEVVKRVCEKEMPDYDLYVSVSLVTKEEIKEINKEQRNIDMVTDVLSFPFLNFDENYKLVNELSEKDYDPQLNAVFLGDMVICTDKITEQAKEFGHSEERELSYLTCHSMYHLMGYDHEDENMKKVMREKEEEILKDLKL